MKIALASAPVLDKDIAFNLEAMLAVLRDCRGKADLVLFGESVLQGFNSLCWDYEQDRRMAVTITEEPIQRMREAAREYGVAVSFGYIERVGELLYSSQMVIDAAGAVIHNFHRVSQGWKEYWKTDGHYREGAQFEKFRYAGKTFAVGLCGDLWTEGRPEEMKALNADVVLWPVWCDYTADEWNGKVKYEYAEQAALCGDCVLLVNPFCADPDAADAASGGGVHFRNGTIKDERPAGSAGTLITDV